MMPSIVLIKNRKTEHTIVGLMIGTDRCTSYDTVAVCWLVTEWLSWTIDLFYFLYVTT